MRQRRNLSAMMFLALPVGLFIAFFVYPICYTLYLSFMSWNGFSPQMNPVGLYNYHMIVNSVGFRQALMNNTLWLAFQVMIPPGLGLALALLLNKGFRGHGIFETIIFIPNTITMVAVATIWGWLYVPGGGLLNEVLRGIGLAGWAQNWLGNPRIATFSIMICAIWAGVGFSFIIYLAGLKTIPGSLIEAAKIDGASFIASFRHVIWPMLAPSTAIVYALQALGAIKLFDLIYSLTGGGPAYFTTVLAVFMYDISFTRFQMGQGAATAIVLLLVSAVVITPYLLYSLQKVEGIRQ